MVLLLKDVSTHDYTSLFLALISRHKKRAVLLIIVDLMYAVILRNGSNHDDQLLGYQLLCER
jgi:hypothetical protein